MATIEKRLKDIETRLKENEESRKIRNAYIAAVVTFAVFMAVILYGNTHFSPLPPWLMYLMGALGVVLSVMFYDIFRD